MLCQGSFVVITVSGRQNYWSCCPQWWRAWAQVFAFWRDSLSQLCIHHHPADEHRRPNDSPPLMCTGMTNKDQLHRSSPSQSETALFFLSPNVPVQGSPLPICVAPLWNMGLITGNASYESTRLIQSIVFLHCITVSWNLCPATGYEFVAFCPSPRRQINGMIGKSIFETVYRWSLGCLDIDRWLLWEETKQREDICLANTNANNLLNVFGQSHPLIIPPFYFLGFFLPRHQLSYLPIGPMLCLLNWIFHGWCSITAGCISF